MNDTTGWEIRSFDMLHQIINCAIWVVHEVHHSIHNFTQVVRWHVGRHPDCNSRGTIHQQVRNFCREDSGLLETLVKIGPEVDGLLVQVRQHVFSDFAEPGLRVAHRSRVVPINRAKVPLPIDHGITQRPMLRHANHGVIHRTVAMWVILTEHLPYNPC